MKALKINVAELCIEEVEVNSPNDIYKHLGEGVTCFACPVMFENLDSIYCDDEGWFKRTQGGFMMPDWNYPIVNNALILGTDLEGNSVDVKMTAEELQRKIIYITANAMLHFKPEGI